VPHRRLFVLSLIMSLPAAASAQFTTFIPPQIKVTESPSVAVTAPKAAAVDTTLNTRLTNLKTWVDSAAGIPAAPKRAPDSVAVPNPPAAVPKPPSPVLDSVERHAPDTAALRNGMRAPATASDLPLLALIGSAALGLGALMLGAGGNRRMRTDA
jgi:hypothetical protein